MNLADRKIHIPKALNFIMTRFMKAWGDTVNQNLLKLNLILEKN